MSRALSRTHLRKVVSTINKFYPEKYADSAWDNTGLLIDCSLEEVSTLPKVLLTIDLTESVAEEAVKLGCNLIVAYHPFIFPSWKKLTPFGNVQHASAIKLIQNGISVYSPHTAVDAAKNGVNDWLASSLGGLLKSNVSIEGVTPIQGEESHEVGYGRVVEFEQALSLKEIISNVKQCLDIPFVQIATKYNLENHMIRKVAICAGSGSSVFKSLREDVDLYYTGELSHHEILKYKESGKSVLVCNHSNTERGFIKQIMYPVLSEAGLDCHIALTDVDPLQVV